VFRRGQIVARVAGALPPAQFLRWVRENS